MMLQMREFDPEGQQDVLGHGQLDTAVLAQHAAVYGHEGLAMFTDLDWFNDPGAQTMIPIPEGAKSASIPNINSQHLEKILSMPMIEEAADQILAQADSIQRQMDDLGVVIKAGSYAWAISGERTSTGNPMLYSGPQMGFSVPSIVQEGSIRAGGSKSPE